MQTFWQMYVATYCKSFWRQVLRYASASHSKQHHSSSEKLKCDGQERLDMQHATGITNLPLQLLQLLWNSDHGSSEPPPIKNSESSFKHSIMNVKSTLRSCFSRILLFSLNTFSCWLSFVFHCSCICCWAAKRGVKPLPFQLLS